MIDIIVTRRSDGLTDRAQAETAEDAIYAARRLYDEAWDRCPVQGATHSITTVIVVDGQHFRTLEGVRA